VEERRPEVLLDAPLAGRPLRRVRPEGEARRPDRRAARRRRAAAAATRALDRAARWMRVPSVPDFFRPFSGWFVYGLGGDGPDGAAPRGGARRAARRR